MSVSPAHFALIGCWGITSWHYSDKVTQAPNKVRVGASNYYKWTVNSLF